jgi:hypothetical protein
MILAAKYGKNYIPPSASGIFADVPIKYWASGWIEALYKKGITKGCSKNPMMYCPEEAVSREQIAVYLLKSKYGPNYTPPSATGIFNDVPVNSDAADWIEQLYKEGITKGCGRSPLKYCPDRVVNRATMAVFFDRMFGL